MTDLRLRDGNLTLDVPNITESAYEEIYEAAMHALDRVQRCSAIAARSWPGDKVEHMVDVVQQVTKNTAPPSGDVNERFLACLQMLGRVIAIHALVHEDEDRQPTRHDA